uniref:A-kinase anchoring protein 10 n=1 Tax=Molossus molossus TaxID=27622 RepID=A0A7J8BJV4_MOLMO|nr:A-kinase anchoring protein 10 [Molossus molossus]
MALLVPLTTLTKVVLTAQPLSPM